MRRRRSLLYAALALAVPLPAFALGGAKDSGALPAAGRLGVAASLDGCGVLENSVVCRIDASFSPVAGASYYTASVTRADGSVVDYGTIGPGGGTSFWVPYAGDGTYSVQVSAYGTPPGAEKPELLAKDSAGTGGGRRSAEERRSPGASDGDGAGEPTGGPGGGSADGPKDDTGGSEEPPTEPDCDGERALADPAGASGSESSATGVATLEETGETPESVECPGEEPAPEPVTEPDAAPVP